MWSQLSLPLSKRPLGCYVHFQKHLQIIQITAWILIFVANRHVSISGVSFRSNKSQCLCFPSNANFLQSLCHIWCHSTSLLHSLLISRVSRRIVRKTTSSSGYFCTGCPCRAQVTVSWLIYAFSLTWNMFGSEKKILVLSAGSPQKRSNLSSAVLLNRIK